LVKSGKTGFTRCFLVSEALQRIVRVEKEAESAQVVLRGQCGQTMIEQTVVLRQVQSLLYIEVNTRLTGNPPKLEYLLVPQVMPNAEYAKTYYPDFRYSPDNSGQNLGIPRFSGDVSH
jgi:hypothetical protein